MNIQCYFNKHNQIKILSKLFLFIILDDTFLLENRLPSLSDSQHMMYTADDNFISTETNEIKSESNGT